MTVEGELDCIVRHSLLHTFNSDLSYALWYQGGFSQKHLSKHKNRKPSLELELKERVGGEKKVKGNL